MYYSLLAATLMLTPVVGVAEIGVATGSSLQDASVEVAYEPLLRDGPECDEAVEGASICDIEGAEESEIIDEVINNGDQVSTPNVRLTPESAPTTPFDSDLPISISPNTSVITLSNKTVDIRDMGNLPTMVNLTAGDLALEFAMTQMGVRYRFGGMRPGVAFDCSGLTRWAYLEVGYDLPHSSWKQRRAGTQVSREDARPGDLLWSPGHIAMYISDRFQIHAPSPGGRVEIVPIDWNRVREVVRPY